MEQHRADWIKSCGREEEVGIMCHKVSDIMYLVSHLITRLLDWISPCADKPKSNLIQRQVMRSSKCEKGEISREKDLRRTPRSIVVRKYSFDIQILHRFFNVSNLHLNTFVCSHWRRARWCEQKTIKKLFNNFYYRVVSPFDNAKLL